MTLIAQRLSDRIEAGAVRRVIHPTRRKLYVGDRLRQVFPTAKMKHVYDVSHGVRSQADYLSVLGAFYTVLGGAYTGLLFKDQVDHVATQDNSSCTLVSGSTYQLNRVYAFGAFSYVRPITRPRNDGTLAVFDAGGTPLTPTVDYDDGTFTVASGTPATWSGQFDVPVAFVANEWNASLAVSTSNLHLVNEPIELEEIFE